MNGKARKIVDLIFVRSSSQYQDGPDGHGVMDESGAVPARSLVVPGRVAFNAFMRRCAGGLFIFVRARSWGQGSCVNIQQCIQFVRYLATGKKKVDDDL